MAETTQSAFRRNAQAALQDGTFEDILKALVIKLLELGVPNAETPDEADKINHPLKMAYNKAQTPEQSDLAWNDLSTRILALGSLLPPEAADGAFLADRGQVEELNKKWDEFWSARLWAKMNKESPVGPSHANERDEDGGAGLLEGGIFSMSREKTSALIWSFYTGRAPSEYQPPSVGSREALPEAEELKTMSAVASTAPSASGNASEPAVSQPEPVSDKAAAAALSQHEAKSATEKLSTLLEVLAGRDNQAAASAATALGWEGNADAVEPLLAVFTRASRHRTRPYFCYSKSPVVVAAAQALGRIGDRRALDTLVEAISKYGSRIVEAAVEAVIALGGDPRAVVPTLKAHLPINSFLGTSTEAVVFLGTSTEAVVELATVDTTTSIQDQKARLRAVGKMGFQAFEPLLAATEDPDADVRSLALRALPDAAGRDPKCAERRARAMAHAGACLADQSASVRVSAVRVLEWLDAPGRTDLLLPLLSDTGRVHLWIDKAFDVREAAADALPDGEATARCLHHALDGTPLADGSQTRASSVWSALTSGDMSRRKVRWLDIVAPYVVLEGERDDEPWGAASVLLTPQFMEVLDRVAPDKRKVAEEIILKVRKLQEALDISSYWRKEQPSPPRPPEQVRAAILVRFERLAEEALAWLAWRDADLLALPLDLKQAWVEGPSAWEVALRSTDLWLPSTKHDPQVRPQEVHRAAPFQAAEQAYMKSHLSAEDCAWYMAAERVGAMRDEAQAAWQKGPLAWAAFFAPPDPKPS